MFAAREVSLSESETARAWLLAENKQLAESAMKERAKLEAECRSAKESAKKAREELEGNMLILSHPFAL